MALLAKARPRVIDLARPRARLNGVVPFASIATFSPVMASSMAPRAMVRLPSERISTTSLATTGGSGARD